MGQTLQSRFYHLKLTVKCPTQHHCPEDTYTMCLVGPLYKMRAARLNGALGQDSMIGRIFGVTKLRHRSHGLVPEASSSMYISKFIYGFTCINKHPHIVHLACPS